MKFSQKINIHKNIKAFYNVNLCANRHLQKISKKPTPLPAPLLRGLRCSIRLIMTARRLTPMISVLTLTIATLLFWASFSGASAKSSEAAFVEKTVSSHKIVIFSKSYCPYDPSFSILLFFIYYFTFYFFGLHWNLGIWVWFTFSKFAFFIIW